MMLCLPLILGCATVQEPFKVIWGTSTQAIEEARAESVRKIYQCDFDQCFDAVLSLARKKSVVKNEYLTLDPNQPKPTEEQTSQSFSMNKPQEDNPGFDVFIQDRIKALMVVMGIAGSTDTTEAGIFFSRYNRESIKIEISSLSSRAKQKVAQMVFGKLSQDFKEIK